LTGPGFIIVYLQYSLRKIADAIAQRLNNIWAIASTQVVESADQGLTAVAPIATAVQNAAEAVSTAVQSASAVNLSGLQLLLGTLKLAETSNAVTKEQATTLLPLWNNFKTLSMSMALPSLMLVKTRAAGQLRGKPLTRIPRRK
jgi:hypothetical protein